MVYDFLFWKLHNLILSQIDGSLESRVVVYVVLEQIL